MLTQYDDEDDYEFYAEGVTLAMEHEKDEVTYYRGNAIVRITNRDVRPGPKPPTRRRVDNLRRRLFRMDQLVEANQDENGRGLPDSDAKLPTTDRRTPQSEDPLEGMKTTEETHGRWQEMTRDELQAVAHELMERPIEEMARTAAYEIHKDQAGKVIVTRLPNDPAQWKAEEETKERSTGRSDNIEQKTGSVLHAALTQYGSDPQASDHEIAIRGTTDENKSFEPETIPWDPTESQGPQPWWEPPAELSNHWGKGCTYPEDTL